VSKACLKYPAWKKNNGPNYRPWLNMTEYKLKPLDYQKILQIDLKAGNTNTEEAGPVQDLSSDDSNDK
jgi:hypothetical protein